MTAKRFLVVAAVVLAWPLAGRASFLNRPDKLVGLRTPTGVALFWKELGTGHQAVVMRQELKPGGAKGAWKRITGRPVAAVTSVSQARQVVGTSEAELLRILEIPSLDRFLQLLHSPMGLLARVGWAVAHPLSARLLGRGFLDRSARDFGYRYRVLEVDAKGLTKRTVGVVTVTVPTLAPNYSGAFTVTPQKGTALITIQDKAPAFVAGFQVERATAQGPFKVVSKQILNADGKPTLSWRDRGLAAGVLFRYRARPVLLDGRKGRPSPVRSLKLDAARVALAAPVISSTQLRGQTIYVAWTPRPQPAGTSYRLERSGSPRGPWRVEVQKLAPRAGHAQVAAGRPGSYQLRLVAVGPNRRLAAGRPRAVKVAAAGLAAPVNVRLKPGASRVTLSWTLARPNLVSQVEVWRTRGTSAHGARKVTALSPSITTFTDPRLHPGTSYRYFLRAVGKDGSHRDSKLAVVTPH